MTKTIDTTILVKEVRAFFMAMRETGSSVEETEKATNCLLRTLYNIFEPGCTLKDFEHKIGKEALRLLKAEREVKQND